MRRRSFLFKSVLTVGGMASAPDKLPAAAGDAGSTPDEPAVPDAALAGGGLARWEKNNYWDPAGRWDFKPDGSTRHWVGVHPILVEKMPECRECCPQACSRPWKPSRSIENTRLCQN